jgi:thioredoxin reductase (NADPH)
MVDVIIIGAGPVGLACGIQAKRHGLRARVIEKGALVNSLVGYPQRMEFFSTPELLEIGGHPFPAKGYKPTREEGIEYYRRVAEAEELDVRLYEAVTAVEGHAGHFTVRTESGTHEARRVVLSTGFFDIPNRLDVPGEDLSKVTHYFREPYPYSHQRVAVIGAKNSAAKAALACYRQGADVTLIHRGPAVSDKVKYWIKPDLENRIRDGAIKARFNTTVQRIEEDHLVLATPEGEERLANDWVLAMIGYRPSYDFLERLGIATEDNAAQTPVFNDETFETNRRGLYMAGTVCGGLDTSRWFIENGRFHAQQIMEHIAKTIKSPAEAVGVEA